MSFSAFYQQFRFGSAALGQPDGARRAGLIGSAGPFVGYLGQEPLCVPGDAPALTIGGAGSGKLRDVLAYNVCGFRAPGGGWYAPPRMLVNDPRGELAAISIHNQVRFGKVAYCINPYGLHGLPQHRVNPWDIIKPDSPTFHADVKLLVSDLLPLSGSANAHYFEMRAREWAEALVKARAMRNSRR